jgi:phosphoglycerate dehydrogenase-like enzyme
VARRLSGFECELLHYDPLELMPGRDGELGATAVASLEVLLAASDVVTLHVPLDAGTLHMVGARELALMKRSAVLINTCRGQVLDGEALNKALRRGDLAGAALDVFEVEPLPADHPLLSAPNCLISPVSVRHT